MKKTSIRCLFSVIFVPYGTSDIDRTFIRMVYGSEKEKILKRYPYYKDVMMMLWQIAEWKSKTMILLNKYYIKG